MKGAERVPVSLMLEGQSTLGESGALHRQFQEPW